MEPRLEFLTGVSVERIARTFNEAFSDYQVRMKVGAERWLGHRMRKNAVDLDLSVGAFAGDDLVAFSLTAFDTRQGEPAAFDAATGIVPAYRGRGLAGRMFAFALPRLRERGVRRFLLEVLQANERAIAAYRKVGFTITREFDCFRRDLLQRPADPSVQRKAAEWTIEPVGRARLLELEAEFEWVPSWENSVASVLRIPGEVGAYGAFRDGRLDAMVVHDPVLEWFVAAVTRRERRRHGLASRLVEHAVAHAPAGTVAVRVVNVSRTDSGMAQFWLARGFESFVPQFEMELPIQ